MSGILVEPVVPNEIKTDVAGELYVRPYSLELPGWSAGPQPWCRICKRGVQKWVWDHYADGFWGVAAMCHGKWCGGLLPAHLSPWAIRLEVFCYNEPHLEEAPLWFVTFAGDELQPSAAYITHAIAEAGLMSGTFGEFVRKWGFMLMSGMSGLIYTLLRLQYVIQHHPQILRAYWPF
jgi:hypothetical protein